jgi:hypothetical protein
MPEFCPRCKQPFSNPTRLKTHLLKKNKCRDIKMSVDDFLKEHDRLINVLETAEGPGVKEELQEQKEELEKVKENYEPENNISLNLDEGTGNSTVILGSSKAGKSTLLMYLYRKYYTDFISVLFSDNPQIKLYKDPKLIKSTHFLPQVIKDFHMINRKTKNKYPFCVLMDDIIDQKENLLVKKLILTFRNSNISSIVSLQSPTLLNKANRASVNNIILFKFNSDEMIEQTIRFFLMSHLKGNMDSKIRQYKEMTSDYKFIYLNPRDNKISIHKISP